MTLLRMKDVRKMSEKERKEKLSGLKMELVRSGVMANKSKAKTKEIKRAISRLFTYETESKLLSSVKGKISKPSKDLLKQN